MGGGGCKVPFCSTGAESFHNSVISHHTNLQLVGESGSHLINLAWDKEDPLTGGHRRTYSSFNENKRPPVKSGGFCLLTYMMHIG